jgi:hypothetical protein
LKTKYKRWCLLSPADSFAAFIPKEEERKGVALSTVIAKKRCPSLVYPNLKSLLGFAVNGSDRRVQSQHLVDKRLQVPHLLNDVSSHGAVGVIQQTKLLKFFFKLFLPFRMSGKKKKWL